MSTLADATLNVSNFSNISLNAAYSEE